MTKTSSKMLTDTELEFMTVLWQLGEGTVNDVLAHLPAERKPAYTSVFDDLKNPRAERSVEHKAQKGRGHVYIQKFPNPNMNLAP